MVPHWSAKLLVVKAVTPKAAIAKTELFMRFLENRSGGDARPVIVKQAFFQCLAL